LSPGESGRLWSQTPLIRRLDWTRGTSPPGVLIEKEWLVANGLGGYASASISGICTRRYHGLLVAALPAPFGRMVMLARVQEEVIPPGGPELGLGGEWPWQAGPTCPGAEILEEFRLEDGLPQWRFRVGDLLLEKSVWLPHFQNTVFVSYRLLNGAGPVTVRLHPFLNFRALSDESGGTPAEPYNVLSMGRRYEFFRDEDAPRLRLFLHGTDGAFQLTGWTAQDCDFATERERGYTGHSWTWSPGVFNCHVTVEDEATLVASTEPWDALLSLTPERALVSERQRRRRMLALARPEARDGPGGELALAADQFVVAPMTRVGDLVRARARGDEIRSVIAGYHWFTDWGRDTMISLEGLTLSTNRPAEAGFILRTFAQYVDRGLIPNMFPEGATEARYNTADASLWFFHAVDRYLKFSGDEDTLAQLLPVLRKIVFHHVNGTLFGIGVDPADGLLRQGAPGYQLTWMDAKVGDWVVTPRRGKAVEINALWYNALRLMGKWLEDADSAEEAQGVAALAGRVFESFNRRFWFAEGGHLYDVVDGEAGDDASFRPNQIFAVSLPHPVLESSRWKAVVDAVEARLLTPLGLRSLEPGHPDYRMKYAGDLLARDAAYHQGTVWSWLIGPFVDAWLRVHPEERRDARKFLTGLIGHLGDGCIGSISEVFDGDPPFRPGGCVAQAWGVAELLRAWLRTAEPEERS
jgi:predicted glycogen debranching enzyme